MKTYTPRKSADRLLGAAVAAHLPEIREADHINFRFRGGIADMSSSHL